MNQLSAISNQWQHRFGNCATRIILRSWSKVFRSAPCSGPDALRSDAPYLDPLAAARQSQDYSRKSIRRHLRNVDSFGWWLTKQNLSVAEITDEVVGRYVNGMHRAARAGCAKGYRAHNARGLPRLLNPLRGSGVTPPGTQLAASGDPGLQDFKRYSIVFEAWLRPPAPAIRLRRCGRSAAT